MAEMLKRERGTRLIRIYDREPRPPFFAPASEACALELMSFGEIFRHLVARWNSCVTPGSMGAKGRYKCSELNNVAMKQCIILETTCRHYIEYIG